MIRKLINNSKSQATYHSRRERLYHATVIMYSCHTAAVIRLAWSTRETISEKWCVIESVETVMNAIDIGSYHKFSRFSRTGVILIKKYKLARVKTRKKPQNLPSPPDASNWPAHSCRSGQHFGVLQKKSHVFWFDRTGIERCNLLYL